MLYYNALPTYLPTYLLLGFWGLIGFWGFTGFWGFIGFWGLTTYGTVDGSTVSLLAFIGHTQSLGFDSLRRVGSRLFLWKGVH